MTNQDAPATGADIVRAYLAGQCRWAIYSDTQLLDALKWAAHNDLNKPVAMLIKVLATRGINVR